MNLILEYIFPIVIFFLVYKMFEEGKFGKAVLIKLTFFLISFVIKNSYETIISLGFFNIFIGLIAYIVLTLIFTSIENTIYNRTRTLFAYTILCTIVEFILFFAISLVLTFSI